MSVVVGRDVSCASVVNSDVVDDSDDARVVKVVSCGLDVVMDSEVSGVCADIVVVDEIVVDWSLGLVVSGVSLVL